MVNTLLKTSRLLFYSLKGNYDYAFSQFRYTTYLWRKTLHKLNANKIIQNDNAVVFDLQNAKDRYAFNVINTYKLANYDIYLKPNYNFYTASKGMYFQEIFTFLNIGFFKNEKQLNAYNHIHFVYDYKEHKELNIKDYVSIKITKKDAIKAQSFKFPFGFHPNFYKRLNIKTKERFDDVLFTDFDNNQNAFKIIFAGSTNNDDYYNIKKYFPELIDRNIIFEEIRKYFINKISIDFREKDGKPILISDSLNNICIDEIELFQILKKSDFFIAPPGFEIPFCHNLFESMSCGVIPIIQYSNYLFPNLENGINCLTFTNISELKGCIEKSLCMEASAIKIMKQNVLEYYKKNILPSSFIAKLDKKEIAKTPIFYVSGLSN